MPNSSLVASTSSATRKSPSPRTNGKQNIADQSLPPDFALLGAEELLLRGPREGDKPRGRNAESGEKRERKKERETGVREPREAEGGLGCG